MNVIGILVLFDPDRDALRNAIDSARQFGRLVIVDNSAAPTRHFEGLPNVSYRHNANRGGIAGAFNNGLDWANPADHDYVFTLDQDTQLPKGYVQHMTRFAARNNAAICCPDFVDIHSGTRAGFVHLTHFGYRPSSDDTTDFCISSGLGVLGEVYRNRRYESLFIDHVDTDFCLKAKRAGLRIFVNRELVLRHAIGKRQLKTFLGVTIKPTHHTASRRYYIVRNGWLLSLVNLRIYPGFFMLNLARTIHEILAVVLFEKEKTGKLMAICRGLLHAVLGVRGEDQRRNAQRLDGQA
ncbi:MAG: glycosyltransferase [Quisquiliibacterium sp.]